MSCQAERGLCPSRRQVSRGADPGVPGRGNAAKALPEPGVPYFVTRLLGQVSQCLTPQSGWVKLGLEGTVTHGDSSRPVPCSAVFCFCFLLRLCWKNPKNQPCGGKERAGSRTGSGVSVGSAAPVEGLPQTLSL